MFQNVLGMMLVSYMLKMFVICLKASAGSGCFMHSVPCMFLLIQIVTIAGVLKVSTVFWTKWHYPYRRSLAAFFDPCLLHFKALENRQRSLFQKSASIKVDKVEGTNTVMLALLCLRFNK